LRRRLAKFAEGQRVDFDDCEIDWAGLTLFQSHVIAATRKVRYGETASYGEIAVRAGSPGAARAVGSVMASNRVPIIIPCHRIVAAGGALGGFSSPRGVSLKEQMLDLEAVVARDDRRGRTARQNARQNRRKIRKSFALSNS
jgi:methylated-DNA-[protein]-cysteine S-methyltransferase